MIRTVIFVEMENCLCDLKKGVEDAYKQMFNSPLDLSDMKKPVVLTSVKRDIKPKIKEIFRKVYKSAVTSTNFVAWILS